MEDKVFQNNPLYNSLRKNLSVAAWHVFISLKLGVADETFWEDLCPLEFGKIPALEEDVVCVGFPTGGDNISVTRGVVSRVEIQRYAHSAVELLAIQVRDIHSFAIIQIDF